MDSYTTRKQGIHKPCLHHLIEQQIKQTPDAVAVSIDEIHLTYRELGTRANQLAAALQMLKVEPEVRVGIFIERSLLMIIAWLSVLKAGGAYVPLDPTYPKERRAFIIQDAQVAILLTQHSLLEGLSGSQVPIICLDRDWGEIGKSSGITVESDVEESNIAYIIYTSGSTGMPKGVMLPHRAVCNHAQWMCETFSFTEKDRMLQQISFGFGPSVCEISAPLITGARLVLAHPEIHQDCSYFVQFITQQAITMMVIVPSILQILLQDKNINEYPYLRYVFCGGETLSGFVKEQLLGSSQSKLYNCYGPTETCIIATYWSCERNNPDSLVPIGYPIMHVQIYICDTQLQLVPSGAAGELYIGGHCLARGYLRRPDLTAERFLPNPFSQEPGSLIYKTGDRVRYRSDGVLEFLGRLDYQVKIRGYRIELEEIAMTLKRHPAVQETVILVRETKQSDKLLVAYISSRGETELTGYELRAFLKQHLPEYMIPSSFYFMHTLPVTTHGKIDREGLPGFDAHKGEKEIPFISAHNPLEEILMGIWCDVLEIDQIEVHDNFFDLGGHSLLATQLLSRIRSSLHVNILLPDFFAVPTITQLIEIIEQHNRSQQGLQLPPLSSTSREGSLPLSFAQQRLWFLDQILPNSAFYNIPMAYHLQGALNIQSLRQGILEIMRRHEVLRTRFTTVQEMPVQVIIPVTLINEIPMPIIDLHTISESKRESIIQQLRREEEHRPFNLSYDSLLRMTLLLLGNNDYILLLTVHHAAFDEWSIQILHYELSHLYRVFSTKQSSSLPSLPLQYVDFAMWQRQWMQGKLLEKQLSYWREQLLANWEDFKLFTNYSAPINRRFQGASYTYDMLTYPQMQQLQLISQQESVTLFITLLTIFQALLMHYSGRENVSLLSPITNRSQIELESLIGLFVNTVILSSDLSGNPRFREALYRVREIALGAYAHQDLPFENIVRELGPKRQLNHSPLGQIMFQLHRTLPKPLHLIDMYVTPMEMINTTAKIELSLTLVETERGLKGTVTYDTEVFTEKTALDIMKNFRHFIEQVIAEPEIRLWTLALEPGTLPKEFGEGETATEFNFGA